MMTPRRFACAASLMLAATCPAAAAQRELSSAQKGEPGARAVLAAWAHALERKDFAAAWTKFGHPPSDRKAFARWWSRYRTLKVALGAGSMDAGAGSLYYTSNVTVSGLNRRAEPYRLAGQVVIRRVNDVPGATPRQLRWHIDSADLRNEAVRTAPNLCKAQSSCKDFNGKRL